MMYSLRTLLLFPLFLIGSAFVHAQVAPFLPTTWNQTCYYNDSCPTVSSGGSCGRAYTGCNATAMAQICKYYAWPASGDGSHCNSNLPAQCVNFGVQTYNYASMPANVTSANAEVAKLMYHLGAACDMMYSGTSSNSFFSSTVLKEYFWYSPKMYSTATFLFNTTQELIDAIKLEIDSGRPVFAKGGNHFYLIDGYNASNQFHMNFGWSGVYDGYYDITNVVNGAGTFTPGNFIFMIRPLLGDLETANDTIVVTASAGATGFDFTSMLPWTISTPTSWLTTALTSGAPGFINFSDGNTFTPQINNGGTRYGYIYVQNANDVDTIVVQQDPSPFGINPDTLYYTAAGGSQSTSLTYYSWASWTSSVSATWLMITPSSGTGNGTPSITATSNPGTPRSGYVAFSGGAFRDTVWILQDSSITTGIDESVPYTFDVFPNPANSSLSISVPYCESYNIIITDAGGRIMLEQNSNTTQRVVDISSLHSGIYFIRLYGENFESETKCFVKVD